MLLENGYGLSSGNRHGHQRHIAWSALAKVQDNTDSSLVQGSKLRDYFHAERYDRETPEYTSFSSGHRSFSRIESMFIAILYRTSLRIGQ